MLQERYLLLYVYKTKGKRCAIAIKKTFRVCDATFFEARHVDEFTSLSEAANI
jgi:hypothetical protein